MFTNNSLTPSYQLFLNCLQLQIDYNFFTIEYHRAVEFLTNDGNFCLESKEDRYILFNCLYNEKGEINLPKAKYLLDIGYQKATKQFLDNLKKENITLESFFKIEGQEE